MYVDVIDEPIVVSDKSTKDEARALFDSVCRYYLEMSGQEFLTKWNQGSITYKDAETNPGVSRAIAVLPFAA